MYQKKIKMVLENGRNLAVWMRFIRNPLDRHVTLSLCPLPSPQTRNHLVSPYVCLWNRVRFISFSMEKRRQFLIHTIIAYDLRVCHSFEQRSFRQFQTNRKEKLLICIRPIHLLKKNIKSSYFTQILLMIWGCVMILTHGHCCKFKSIVKNVFFFLSCIVRENN